MLLFFKMKPETCESRECDVLKVQQIPLLIILFISDDEIISHRLYLMQNYF